MIIISFIIAFTNQAGVVKLVDALDSKSSELYARVGSIPTSGTIQYQSLFLTNRLFYMLIHK